MSYHFAFKHLGSSRDTLVAFKHLGSSRDTLVKLGTFAELPHGWRYGRGGPVLAPVLAEARRAYFALVTAGFTRTDAFAGVDGDVLVSGYYGSHYIGVIVESADCLSLLYEVEGKEVYSTDQITMTELRTEIRSVAEKIWTTFASSTQGTTTTSVASSMSSRSGALLAAAGCRSSN